MRAAAQAAPKNIEISRDLLFAQDLQLLNTVIVAAAACRGLLRGRGQPGRLLHDDRLPEHDQPGRPGA
eukprot:SAG22_NODE_1008_length_6054_cov_11.023678_10_plen_68_part_00